MERGGGASAAGPGDGAAAAGAEATAIAAPSAPRAASIISRQVGKRSSGAFAIARAITASSASGSSGRASETFGGGSVMCANMTATSVSRSYGFLPVSVW